MENGIKLDNNDNDTSMKKLITLCLMVLFATEIYAERAIQRDEYHYATHDGQMLYLDRYTSSQCSDSAPCMIFAFGGGFVRGERNHEYYTEYFERLAEAGIVVVSIDYRLGLKDISAESELGIRDMVIAMQRSVDIAVEDLYTATCYVIEHAAEWGVDSEKIMISGSSAGAITALQAEWGCCNRSQASQILPEGFRYAGVVACAGAIFSTSGRPKWELSPAPTMLFHGTSDRNVPYRKASIMGIGFYGSEYIATQLDKMASPYYFYSVKYADHAVAVTPLIDQIELILQFIDEYVVEGRRLCTVTEVESPDVERAPTHFSAKEYLEANYSPR